MSRIARVVSRRGWQLLLNATGTDVQCTVHLHYTGMGDGAFLDVDWNLLFFCIINQLSTRSTSYFILKFFFKILKGHEVFTVTSLASCFYNHVAWHGVQYSENCTVIPLYTVQTHGLIHPKQGKVLCKSNTENILLFCYYSVLKPQKTQWFWYD